MPINPCRAGPPGYDKIHREAAKAINGLVDFLRVERRSFSHQKTDEWTLQSGFDGDELLARPSVELVTVDSAIAKKAAQRIESCEHCHPPDAEIPFDWLLAEVTGKPGPYEFMMSEAARCPNCKHEITEKTLVEPKD